MNQFWQEYLYFIVSFFAILVSVSAGILFIITLKYERKLLTVWRTVGFLSLAVAFFLYILERKFAQVGLVALVIEFVGFFCIYKGVLAEPKLSQLAATPPESIPIGPNITSTSAQTLDNKKTNPKKERTIAIIQIAVSILIFILVFIFLNSFIASTILGGATAFIIATIPIQIRRYRKQKSDPSTRAQNIYPLIGYIFLALMGITLIFYRLPDLNIVIFRQLKFEYGLTWQLGMVFTFLGFLFLAIWAWNYIKLRVFLRIYVILLTIAIIISSLGSLIFTTLIFGIVEKNNLNLMDQGAQTQALIMAERTDNAAFIASTLSQDPDIIKNIDTLINNQELNQRIDGYFKNSGVDYLRIYNKYGEVLASPNDIRDLGRKFNEDNYLAFAIAEKKLIKSFFTQPGVLTPTLSARGIVPLISTDAVVGAIEVGYNFDNAYVDFAKTKTTLDVTMYTDIKRSATTILSLDGVSRWVGSNESDENVIKNVIEGGNPYSGTVERLGTLYYSGFLPVRNINNQIIGMVAVGTPTRLLFEDTKQQLVTTFLVLTLISLLAAALGYYAVSFFQRKY